MGKTLFSYISYIITQITGQIKFFGQKVSLRSDSGFGEFPWATTFLGTVISRRGEMTKGFDLTMLGRFEK